ncbi:VOC family protein [Aquimarina sp. RZ0]|uniref:VOC family protein n=1 Tax=Aquimarina sp. RZ0 TaxID=2607730 RepID=UPI0011F3F5B5|nr:hypothetical protein [Aquimarina sp. RZ0]KAA1244922.1 hypothetical protein F0000_14370 [Aquimarina sp. RZ0]
MFQLKSILEIVYSVGDIKKVKNFFCDYGGWNITGTYNTNSSILDFWQLDTNIHATEFLIQSNNHPTGQLRLIKFEGIAQEYIRSSQQPWDIGGIMDINLRVHEVNNTFEELRELGWHGLSDPLLQIMGAFKLYDILMKGYDDTIIAFTHRVEPPVALKAPIKLPTHVYNSSLVVRNLQEAREFYIDQLGCSLLNEYEVKKDSPQESMFGLPFNLADKVNCKANILSFDGSRDTVFQIIEFEGITGKDFTHKAVPPNRGFMTYRIEVIGIKSYYDHLIRKGVHILNRLQKVRIPPYDWVDTFAIKSPEGVWFTFLEK